MFSIKVELKLNNKEKTLMAKHCDYSRFVYNYALAIYNSLDYREFKGGSSKKLDAIKKVFTNYTKQQPEHQWMSELSSRVYQYAFINLKKAFSKFFKNSAAYPSFKTKKNNESFTVDDSDGKRLLTKGKSINIPTLGIFRLKEKLKVRYVTQTFTISRQADKWYVSFSVDAERIPPTHHEIEECGIDLGVSCFATISDPYARTKLYAPKPMKKAKTKLTKKQWRNRNKQKGNRKKGIKQSNNAKKHYQQLSKAHKKIADQRQDFLQKTTTQISKKYYRIRIEDLNVAGMIANRKLSAAISDLGFYEFRRQLEYKQYFYGTNVELVDRWYPSSKQCIFCKQKHPSLTLSDRLFICPTPNCPGKTPMDRDEHAAINLRLAPDDKVVSLRKNN